MITVSLLQILLGILVLTSALGVVLSRNPIVSAMMLMSTLFLTGGLYISLGLYFIGAVQILIYAGAIAVLFIFIVMLLDMKTFKMVIPGRKIIGALGLVAAAMIFASFYQSILSGQHFNGATSLAGTETVNAADPKIISLHFLSKYMIAFQMTGLLILGAIMGAVVLGKPVKPKMAGNFAQNTTEEKAI